jgi:hypothetical protein
MTLELGGLAAGDYVWTSFHHDTEHVFGPFAVWLSTDGGATFTQLDDGVMTDSTTGGSPDSGATEVGPDAYSLSSTYHASFRADGINAVVFRFAPYSEGAVHRQIWGMNGFVLELEKTVLFSEDFEGLPLGPSIDEGITQGVAGENVWTDTPPEGWTVDESGIPGIGMDATDGVTEWAGWAFADKAWWTETAGDQDRSMFELGSGIVAVADPDEWDDDERLPIPIEADPYDTWLTTPAIDIAGAEAGTLQLKFDSSWRPEFDDNYHQTASITASFDGGDPVLVMLWESDGASDNFHPYATNETVTIDLEHPEGARRLVLTFGLSDAGNDWWSMPAMTGGGRLTTSKSAPLFQSRSRSIPALMVCWRTMRWRAMRLTAPVTELMVSSTMPTPAAWAMAARSGLTIRNAVLSSALTARPMVLMSAPERFLR